MTTGDLQDTVFALLRKVAPGCKPEMLKPDDDIRKTLDIDSFDYLQFIVALSKYIRRDIPEEHYAQISTLNKLFHYVANS